MTPDERATEVIAPLAKMAAHGRPVPLGMLLETLHADIAAAITAAVEEERDKWADAVADIRDAVLNERYQLAEEGATSDIINAVLGIIDDHTPDSDETCPRGESKGENG